MNKTAEQAVKGVKELGHEVSAWEVRVSVLQNESANLQKKNESIKKEIESALAIAQAELDKKRELSRLEMAKLDQATAKLEADKVEFQGILTLFNKEKSAFEAERTKMIDRDADVQKLRAKLDGFVYMIRVESQKI